MFKKSLVIISIIFLVVIVTGFFVPVPFSRFFPPDSTNVKNNNISEFDYGAPFIINFKINENFEMQNWAVAQDTIGLMYFANRRGIITFDGAIWNFVKTPNVPYSIACHAATNTIFVGGSSGFGYLNKAEKGNLKYISLSDSITFLDEITKIVFSQSDVFFFGSDAIVRVNLNNFKDKVVIARQQNTSYGGLFRLHDEIYVSLKTRGFYKVDKALIKPQVILPLTENVDIKFTIPYDNENVLLGLSDNRLMLFNGQKLTLFPTEATDYLNKFILSGGTVLQNNMIALSTLSGGIIIIDINNGKIKNILSYQTGLPDDEIFAMFCDKDNAIWISHNFGISRIDYSLPIRNFDAYLGLEGIPVTSFKTDSLLYVASTEGLYYLTTIKDKTELETIIKKQQIKKITKKVEQKNVNSENNIVQVQLETNATVDVEEKKGLLDRWKEKREEKKKKKREKDREKEIQDSLRNIPEQQKNEINKAEDIIEPSNQIVEKTYIVKNIKKNPEEKNNAIPQVNLVYKKIEGINEKCKQIISANGSMIVASNQNIYEVKKISAQKIYSTTFILSVLQSIHSNRFYIATLNEILLAQKKNGNWVVKKLIDKTRFQENIVSISEEDSQTLWVGCEFTAFRLELDNDLMVNGMYPYFFDIEIADKIIVKSYQGKTHFFLSNMVARYQKEENLISPIKTIDSGEEIFKIINSQRMITWIKWKSKWDYFSESIKIDSAQQSYLNLIDEIRDIKVDNHNNIWIIDGQGCIFRINSNANHWYLNQTFDLFLKNAYTDIEKILDVSKIRLDYHNKSIHFDITAPFYLKQGTTKYRYFVDKIMDSWSPWSDNHVVTIYAQPGKYKLHIMASNVLGQISTEKVISFTIEPPFWQTNWFRFMVGFVAVFIAVMVVLIVTQSRQMALQKRNEILEIRVKERTTTIEKQTKEITDSILYASTIQNAILTPEDIIEGLFTEFFIYNTPRDVVSGDFYFVHQNNGKIFVAVADCTGHGVPGAFLSMMGIAYLKEIVNKQDDLYPDIVLNQLSKEVISSLHQDSLSARKEGMDIAVSVIEKSTGKVYFSGAYNPLYIVRNGELIEIEGDRQPIGFYRGKNKPFTRKVVETEPEDSFYMFSDGFIDQFNYQTGKKFLRKNFKKLITLIADMDINLQKELLIQAFADWKGDAQQVDDVLIFGFRI